MKNVRIISLATGSFNVLVFPFSPMGKSILREKSYAFAIRIVKFSKLLQHEKKEFILSKQLIRSGTAIGALIREAEFGQSKADFANKMSIALKEANETEYWLLLLNDAEYLEKDLLSRGIAW